MSRYSRHILLEEIGQLGQEKINASRVLVVGAGGLGCPVLQYLAAAGVGTLGIIDFDSVEESNLQRQILFGTSSIGENKAVAAKKSLQNLNPTIAIESYPKQLTSQNAVALFKKYDIIIDGTDNFATRYLINDAAVLTDKPFVYGAIYKFEGQVSVFNYRNGPSYRCVFSSPPKNNVKINCNEVGVLGVLPGIIGTMQAGEILKIILGIGTPLSGQLYCYNTLSNTSQTLSIYRQDKEITKIRNRGDILKMEDYKLPPCDNIYQKISLTEINSRDTTQFIDVREFEESPKLVHKKIISMPLSVIEQRLDKVSSANKKVFFCKSGARSKKALDIMKSYNIKNCWLLKENATEIANAISNDKL